MEEYEPFAQRIFKIQFNRVFLLLHIVASNYAGSKAIVAGWGDTCVLRDVKVSIMTNLDCVRGTSYVSGMITENMMCAGYVDGEEDSCQV